MHWTFSANPAAINAMDFMQNVVDNNIASRWSTGANQVPGQYFQIDFGGTVSLTQVVLDATNNAGDYPRGYDIGLSALGTTFTSVAMNAANANIVVTETFAAAQGRYLRITQKGTFTNWWSIDELRLACTVPGRQRRWWPRRSLRSDVLDGDGLDHGQRGLGRLECHRR